MAGTYYDAGERRSEKVNALFRRIASRYDLVNDVQSAGLHRLWKRRVARFARVQAGQRALDICCGTGDLTLDLVRGGAEVIGLDFTSEMLQVAQARGERAESKGRPPEGSGRKADVAEPGAASRRMFGRKMALIRGDAEKLPFQDNTFDAVTVGYGLRNLSDWQLGVKEMKRVTKPGGRLVILEFGKPENALWRNFYLGYLRVFVPLLGLIFYRNASTYRYILESLRHYPSQIEIAARMREMGLERVNVLNILGGAMSIHCAEKPPDT